MAFKYNFGGISIFLIVSEKNGLSKFIYFILLSFLDSEA